ncbi:AAA family ATPase [Candidatus Bathyarchaeota archaeon]|nr:AAA family ATPase [Candidatus Bathyarchaeota archaeon]
MLIREIILENFMSYEYARIPLKPGLNIICGPNGAGKSSILLGISVALGQSYTERSRKLSDLIRRGKDQGRCTLILDNRKRNGKRPVPRINKDDIILSRYLRVDGKYWFEIEGKAASKSEVNRLLSKFGVDPENMLIIMHQNMVEEFIVLSPQEKLRLLEAAIGLEPYRQNVMNAEKKLSRILSERESINRLMESARHTLNYWREQYDRYQRKKQLRMKRIFLERELLWSRVNKLEKERSKLNDEMESLKGEIAAMEEKMESGSRRIQELNKSRLETSHKKRDLLKKMLELERERARREVEVNLAAKEIKEIDALNDKLKAALSNYSRSIASVEEALKAYDVETFEIFRSSQQTIGELIKDIQESFTHKLKLLKDETLKLKGEIEELTDRLLRLSREVESLEDLGEKLNEELTKHKVDYAILSYQKEDLERKVEALHRQIKDLEDNLSKATLEAERLGPRLVTFRNEDEIMNEIKFTDGHLLALSDVSEDIERMYESYSKLYMELEKKAKEVEENRKKALEEVKSRMEDWKKVIQGVIDKVNLRYQSVLAKANASGEIKLINDDDIERAGLVLYVGFRGTEPVPLNVYTQSGGERSTATMAFLIALQEHIRSPFRAVDEYDVHMDPKNREIISELLLSVIESSNVQYLVITPSQLNFDLKNVHIITIQNIAGSSIVAEMV